MVLLAHKSLDFSTTTNPKKQNGLPIMACCSLDICRTTHAEYTRLVSTGNTIRDHTVIISATLGR